MSAEARLTHADIAERLNMPLSTVVEIRKREGWPHVRVGKAVRFTEEQVGEIIASHVVADGLTEAEVFPGQRTHRPRASQRGSVAIAWLIVVLVFVAVAATAVALAPKQEPLLDQAENPTSQVGEAP